MFPNNLGGPDDIIQYNRLNLAQSCGAPRLEYFYGIIPLFAYITLPTHTLTSLPGSREAATGNAHPHGAAGKISPGIWSAAVVFPQLALFLLSPSLRHLPWWHNCQPNYPKNCATIQVSKQPCDTQYPTHSVQLLINHSHQHNENTGEQSWPRQGTGHLNPFLSPVVWR